MAYRNPYFSGMNTGSMLGAVGSGFAAGGPIGAVASGITNYFQQDAQTKQAVDSVNTDFNTSVDAYGRPAYNGAEFAQGLQDFQGLAQAARPGAVSLRPRRRRQVESKVGDLYNALQTGQQNYNQAETAYRDRSLQLQDYYSRQNDINRLANLY